MTFDTSTSNPKNRTGAQQFFQVFCALVLRDLRGRYRRSVLGPLWALIQPLAYMVAFTAVRRILGMNSPATSERVFLLSASVPWSFFANSVRQCGPSVYSNASLIKKIAIPHEVFPLASVGTAFVDFCVALCVLAGIILWDGVTMGIALVWLPPLILLTLLAGLGVGLIIAALGTYKRDVLFGVSFVLQFWMLVSPLFYTIEEVDKEWRALYVLNPMSGLLEGFRSVLLHNTAPDFGLLQNACAGTLLIWLIGWPLFRYMSRYFADVL